MPLAYLIFPISARIRCGRWGYIQAIDTLYVKETYSGYRLPTNVACWISLFMGGTLPPQTILSALSPYVGGFAMTIVRHLGDKVTGEIIESFGDRLTVQELGEREGDYLFQVNLLSQNARQWVEMYEVVNSEKKHKLLQRLHRTNQFLCKKSTEDMAIALASLLSSKAGGFYAYANVDVKANFLMVLKLDGLQIQADPGPRIKGDPPLRIIIPITPKIPHP